VEKIIGRGSGFVAVEIPFTPRAKRVLELALEEARQLGHNYIGTEHLLLGLLREGEGVAARVLENLDADPSKIRSQVGICRGETQLLTDPVRVLHFRHPRGFPAKAPQVSMSSRQLPITSRVPCRPSNDSRTKPSPYIRGSVMTGVCQTSGRPPRATD